MSNWQELQRGLLGLLISINESGAIHWDINRDSVHHLFILQHCLVILVFVIYVHLFSRGIRYIMRALGEPVNKEVQVYESLINRQRNKRPVSDCATHNLY